MLVAYRRHKPTCPHFGEGRHQFHHCKCMIYCNGTLNGMEIRKSVKTRDWTKAQGIVREWEAEERVTEPRVSTSTAWNQFIADLEARNLSNETVRKYRLLRKQMEAFGTAKGLTHPAAFDLSAICNFRSTWKDAPRTAIKKLERLRAFFGFCLDHGWVESNLAKKIKSPIAKAAPTMPLEHKEWTKLLAACDANITNAQPSGKLNALRLKSLIIVMRYSGLRISDAVALTKSDITGNRLTLYMQKTGQDVSVVLHESVLLVLDETPPVTDTRYFWSGNGALETAVKDWQGRMAKIFADAGISKGKSNSVSHRLRDTFAAELLLAGVPLERVSILLGHANIAVTEKHYAPFTKHRQEQIEADLTAAWKQDPSLQKIHSTEFVQIPNGRPN